MAKHDIDPVLRQLVQAINESENATMPITVAVRGTQLTGVLLGERLYFGELVTQNPLMAALEPSSGLLGKEYAKDIETESDHCLHVRTDEGGLWRISLEAVDAWTLPAATGEAPADQGPFARLLGSASR
jgi:hypothetical protein